MKAPSCLVRVLLSALVLSSLLWGAGLALGADSPAASGPVAWWKFDENSGSTVLDASGHGLNGTIRGDAARVAGVAGRALAFSGTTLAEVPFDRRLLLTHVKGSPES